jgi:hypothetical protein
MGQKGPKPYCLVVFRVALTSITRKRRGTVSLGIPIRPNSRVKGGRAAWRRDGEIDVLKSNLPLGDAPLLSESMLTKP